MHCLALNKKYFEGMEDYYYSRNVALALYGEIGEVLIAKANLK